MATLGSQVDSEYILVDTFTGDGSTVVFGPLSIEVPSPGQIGVHNNGYYQIPSTNYSVSANLTERLITFTTAPQNGNTIVVLHLGRGATQFADIFDSAVGITALVDGSVTGPKIAPTAINAGNSIVAGSITGNLINDQTITGQSFATNTITGNLIADETITGDLFATSTITGNLIAATSIRGNQIASDSLTGSILRANTILGNTIDQGAVSVNNFSFPTSTLVRLANNAFGVAKTASISTAGDYTINIPSQTSRLKIIGVGGGGGGGAYVTGGGTTWGGGGGGGAAFIAYINGPFDSNTFNVTIGAGGIGGIANYSANTVTPGSTGGSTRIWNLIANGSNISVTANGGIASNAYNTFGYGRPSAPYGLNAKGGKGGVADVANTTNPSFIILTFAGYDANVSASGGSNTSFNAGQSILGYNNMFIPQAPGGTPAGNRGGIGAGAPEQSNNWDLGYYHDPAIGSQNGWSNGYNGFPGGIIIEY